MMMKKKAIIAVAIIFVFLLMWLSIANNMIEYFSIGSIPQELSFNKFKSSSPVHFYIDEIHVSGGMFMTVRVDGWAFAETKEENSNRYVSLVLKNESSCYEMQFSNCSMRTDVNDKLADVDLADDTKVGIMQDFPTFNMKNGVYDIYIYCWENETDFGLTHSGWKLEKSSSNVTLKRWQSEEMILSEQPVEMETVVCYYDNIEIEDDMLAADGWAFQPGQDCDTQTTYFSINGTVYTTQYSMTRLDVAEAYENEFYTMSGYRTYFPAENIPEGESTVQILIENNGMFYSSPPIKVIRTGDDITSASKDRKAGMTEEVGNDRGVMLQFSHE